MSAHIEKRDAPNVQDAAIPVTTESILDTLKNGVQKTFSQDSLDVSLARDENE